MQAELAQHSFGRILLHLACACRDHNFQWHWRGILREIPRAPRLVRAAASALAVGAACLLFTGCAATQVALEHHSLKVQTRMSHTVFLDAEKPAERTVLLTVKNTSDKNLEVEGLIRQRLEAKGYKLVNSPQQAFYILQANVLRVGLHDPSALQCFNYYDGSDAVLGGAAAGAAIGAAASNLDGDWMGYGAVIGGVAAAGVDLIAGALVKNVTYSMVTDLQILERTDETVDQTITSDLQQGSGTRVHQISESTRERRKYQTRILSTANRVNLSFETALPVLEQDLAKSIAGIL
jgi:hypothetical protein